MLKFILPLLLFTNMTFASILPGVQRVDYVRKAVVDEQRIQGIVDRLEELFSPVFTHHNATLLFEINWQDPTVNLYAEQLGFSWYVHVYQGYYSLPDMDEDAFALSLCHEIGHHISGYPYKSTWSCAEGQADYFANHVCTGMLWGSEDNSSYPQQIPLSLLKLCQHQYTEQKEIELCSRKMKAGLTLAKIMADYSHTTIENDLVELPAVEKIDMSHPAAQCRLNTFIRATLCSKKFNLNVIPGKLPARVVPVPRPVQGTNNLWARNQSYESVCDEEIESEQQGARPHCWFK